MGELSPEAYDFEVPLFYIYCPFIVEKFKKGICLEYHQYWPSAAAMTRHKKCFGKFREIKAIEDTSPESSENDLAMSGQNTLSDKENEFLGKENENDPMPIFNIFELLKRIDFLNLFLVPFL